jgi:hypothetical protein
MALDGVNVIIAASLVLTNFGSFSNSLPDLLSILVWMVANLQAIWAV